MFQFISPGAHVECNESRILCRTGPLNAPDTPDTGFRPNGIHNLSQDCLGRLGNTSEKLKLLITSIFRSSIALHIKRCLYEF